MWVGIHSVKNQTFAKSNMKCPEVYSGFDGLVMSDRRRDEIITYGFVRNLWRESDINHFLFPPLII